MSMRTQDYGTRTCRCADPTDGDFGYCENCHGFITYEGDEPGWSVQIIDSGGLGTVVWDGEADGWKDAVARWATAAGRTVPADAWDDFVDVNGDGDRFDSHGWDGTTLSVERAW